MTILGPAPPVARLPSDPRAPSPLGPHPDGDVVDLLREQGIHLQRPVGRGAGSTAWAATAADGSAVAVKLPVQRSSAEHDALAHEAEVLRHLHVTLRADDADADAGTIVALRQVVRARLRRADGGRGGTGAASGATEALVLTPCGDETLDQWWARKRGARHDGRAEPPTLDHRLTLESLDLVGRLVRALAAMHAAGVVHGDLSPRNVVMCGDRPVVIDFGAATIDGRGGPFTHGTLPFAAPEVVAATAVGPASDLFALARITTALVLGNPSAASGPSLRDELCGAGCAPSLAELVVAAQATDPARRPGVSAWVTALDAEAIRHTRRDPDADRDPDPTRAVTVEFGPRPPRPDPPRNPRHRPPTARRALVAVGLAGLAVVALVLGAVIAAAPPTTGDDAAPATTNGPTTTNATNPGTAAGARVPRDEPQVRWDAARAEATVTTGTAITRYRIGAPGDQLVVGRWQCRGSPRPILYRPSSGALYEFTGWADARQPQPGVAASSRHAVGGHVHAVVGDDGCERAVVDPPPTS